MALGHLAGASFFGLLLIAVGDLLRDAGWLASPIVRLVMICACLFMCLYALLPNGKVVQSHWQVPSQWRYTLDPAVTAAGYGLLLGVGVLTYVVTPAMWSFVALSLFVSPTVAITAWLLYGAVRFLRILGQGAVRDTEPTSILFEGLALRIGSLVMTLAATWFVLG